MYRLAADYSDSAVFEVKLSADNYFGIDTADSCKFKISVIGDVGHDKSDLVLMSGKHDLVFRGISTLFIYYDVAQWVDFCIALLRQH